MIINKIQVGETSYDIGASYANITNTPTKLSDFNNDTEYIDKDVNNLTNYTLSSASTTKLDLVLDNATFKLKGILKNANDDIIYTSNEIDLPLETMVVNATYDSNTKEIVLTLQNGNNVRFSVADLVSGLVSGTQLNQALANYYTKTQIDTTLEDYYTKTETDTIVDTKQDKYYEEVQVMPEASVEELGKTYKYIGETETMNANSWSRGHMFIHNRYYECVSYIENNETKYYWIDNGESNELIPIGSYYPFVFSEFKTGVYRVIMKYHMYSGVRGFPLKGIWNNNYSVYNTNKDLGEGFETVNQVATIYYDTQIYRDTNVPNSNLATQIARAELYIYEIFASVNTSNRLAIFAGDIKFGKVSGSSDNNISTTIIGRNIPLNYSDFTFEGAIKFIGTKIPQVTSYTAPTIDNQLTPKKYVDEAIEDAIATAITEELEGEI